MINVTSNLIQEMTGAIINFLFFTCPERFEYYNVIL